MEVGAVKQAFNNEVILLKKNLNQAKIQVIHKLTRKAKTLTEKKSPEHLKEKLKRKAESAVNEVLILKKIKARDIAKFMITHTGQVSDYLNRPKVDNDKACARLVLHKSLQDKYKFIRNRFGNIPINDLFMSRQERRKLKKEAKEQQKSKKKGKKGNVTKSAGDWDVEDVKMANDGDVNDKDEIKYAEKETTRFGDESDSDQDGSVKSDEHILSDKEISDDEAIKSDDNIIKSDDSDAGIENVSNNESEDEKVDKLIELKPVMNFKPLEKSKSPKSNIDKIEIDFDNLKAHNKQIKAKVNKIDKKVKENKNKNLKEKLQSRKFKKDDDSHTEGRKVVDPFFVTATGENYLSLAEPRQPDEIKEVHKQGNRQERRAAMFGRKFKPRNDFRENSFRSKKFSDSNNSTGRNKNDRFSNEDFNDRNGKFNDRSGKFNDRSGKFSDGNSKFNDNNDRFNSKHFNNNKNADKKEEKLHPSWEAKRKLKSMSLLPSQGKKTVFNDN